LQGVPFQLDHEMRITYAGSFLGLFNPFALLAGVIGVAMLIMHGAVRLQSRSEGVIHARAQKAVKFSAIVFIAAFVLAGVWIASGIEGYKIISMPAPNSVMTPLDKMVEKATGAWLNNYSAYPWTQLAPALAIAAALIAVVLSHLQRTIFSFIFSSLSVACVILTAGFAMFPFIIPSSSMPNVSLTAWDATSSRRTLSIMFWLAMFFLPLIIAYTSWVYSVLRGKITVQTIRDSEHTSY
ncbi:MAG: cytochrome d ubiquinol oxidase subunit II, partial [Burkholderiales bacterium]